MDNIDLKKESLMKKESLKSFVKKQIDENIKLTEVQESLEFSNESI